VKKYIIINGTMGAGKSTVGKRIAEMLGRAAFIDGDNVSCDMYPLLHRRETDAMQKDNIVHISKNYCDFDKCDFVILSWIIGENRADIIPEILKLDFQIHHFILTCSKEVLTHRWHKDEVNHWRTDENLKVAIDFDMDMLDDFNNKIFNFNNKCIDCVLIDTSDLSVDIVAENIIEIVHAV